MGIAEELYDRRQFSQETDDRSAEKPQAAARSFFRIQLVEGGVVRTNNRSRISFGRRYRKFAWVFGTSALVVALLYWEQAAALYVLSTLAMCVMLLIVAFSNLEARDKELHQAALEKMDAHNNEPHSTPAKKRVA